LNFFAELSESELYTSCSDTKMSVHAQNTNVRYSYFTKLEGTIFQVFPDTGEAIWVPCHGTRCRGGTPLPGRKMCEACEGAIAYYRDRFKQTVDGKVVPRPEVSIDVELWARKMERSCWKFPDQSHSNVINDMQWHWNWMNPSDRVKNYWAWIYGN
jgi:hypothetical protein